MYINYSFLRVYLVETINTIIFQSIPSKFLIIQKRYLKKCRTFYVLNQLCLKGRFQEIIKIKLSIIKIIKIRAQNM